MSNVKTPAQKSQTLNAAEILVKYRTQFEQALPKHITVDRMLKLVISQLRANPDLAKATPLSLVGAVMQCCFLGLQPGDGLHTIYLVVFGREVKPIIGYQGMVELIKDSGHVVDIFADVVYKHDHFTYEMSFDGPHPQKPIHKPNLDCVRTRKPSDIKLAYAVAVVRGGLKFEYITTPEIQEAHQKKTDAWNYHWSEMAKKTAIRRIYKTLPKQRELSEALAREENESFSYADWTKDLVGVEVIETSAKPTSLEEQFRQEVETCEA